MKRLQYLSKLKLEGSPEQQVKALAAAMQQEIDYVQRTAIDTVEYNSDSGGTTAWSEMPQVVRVLDVQRLAVDLSDSTSEQEVYRVRIEPEVMGSGVINMRVYGWLNNRSGAPETALFTIESQDTQLWNDTTSGIASKADTMADRTPWMFDLDFIPGDPVDTNSWSLVVGGRLYISVPTTGPVVGSGEINTNLGNAAGHVTVVHSGTNLTSPGNGLDLSIKVTLSTASSFDFYRSFAYTTVTHGIN